MLLLPVVFVTLVFALTIVGMMGVVCTIVALIECVRAPDAAFGPPWDNAKGAWTLGLALAFVIPFGIVVLPILWWNGPRRALRARRPVPRPFWSPGRAPYPYQGPTPPGPPAEQGPPPA